jgi:allantoicase
MSASKRHYFSGKQLQHAGPFSHVRLNMFPDGGISRLRIHGTLARD